MNVAEIFIRRPVMTTLVMLGILMFGIMGYRLLPVSDLPNVDFPTILVSASLPGATPDTMASAVAMPLEKQFSTIAGVDSMTSSSTQGSTQITLQFNLSRNLDAAAQDVQSMIAKAARDLPQNLPSPPSYQKVNPADQPIGFYGFTSSLMPISKRSEANRWNPGEPARTSGFSSSAELAGNGYRSINRANHSSRAGESRKLRAVEKSYTASTPPGASTRAASGKNRPRSA